MLRLLGFFLGGGGYVVECRVSPTAVVLNVFFCPKNLGHHISDCHPHPRIQNYLTQKLHCNLLKDKYSNCGSFC